MKKQAKFLICSALAVFSLHAFAVTTPSKDAVKQNIFVEPVEGLAEDFMMGADISSLSDIERNG